MWLPQYSHIIRFLAAAVFAVMTCQPLFALDLIKVSVGDPTLTINGSYKRELLHTAMLATAEKYGDYDITSLDSKYAGTMRAKRSLQSGKHLNVYFAVTTPTWESSAIPIRIPIRLGLTSYRLLLVNRDNLGVFANVNDSDSLKKKVAGIDPTWATSVYMKKKGFAVVDVLDPDSLYMTLDAKRFDYAVRTVNEVYEELSVKAKLYRDVVIEPRLAFYLPSPTYIFVSKEYSRLAERLNEGMNTLVADGRFREIFYRHFKPAIVKADLGNRVIIKIQNTELPENSPVDDPLLWINPRELGIALSEGD